MCFHPACGSLKFLGLWAQFSSNLENFEPLFLQFFFFPSGLTSFSSFWNSRLLLHALEKEMATHSSILTGRISETEEPGGPLSGVAQSRTLLQRLSSSSSSRLLLDCLILSCRFLRICYFFTFFFKSLF